MSEYGFDYLNDRIDLLDEAARIGVRSGGRRGRVGYNPEENLAILDPEFNKIYEFIGDTIKQGGESEIGGEEIEVVGKGDKRHRYRQLQWPLLVLMELGEDVNFDNDGDGVEEDYEMDSSIKKFCKYILGLDPSKSLARLGIGDNNTLMAKALARIVSGKGEGKTPQEIEQNSELIRPYHQYLKTPEFKERATNVKEMLKFSQQTRVASTQAATAAEVRERKFEMPHEEIDRIQVKAIPLVQAINRAQTAEMKRHNPKYAEMLSGQGRENEASNSFVDDTYMLIDALENLMDIKANMQADLQGVEITDRNKDAIFDEIADTAQRTGTEADSYLLTPEELESLYFTNTDDLFREIKQFLENSINEGGVELEDYQADMGKKRRELPEFAGVLGAYIKEIDGMRAALEEIKEILPDTPDSVGQRYRGYNDKILSMILQTDEDRQIFDAWYKMESKKRAIALHRLGQELRMLAKRDSGVDDPYLTRGELSQFKRGVQEFDKKRAGGNLQQTRPTGPPAPKKVPTKKAPVAPKKPARPEDEEYYESYDVMEYMTEQVIKDKRTNPKGEFKDRGFKKARSYTEWLWINEQRGS